MAVLMSRRDRMLVETCLLNNFLSWRRLAFLTVQSHFKTFRHKSLSQILDALSCTKEGVGDVLVFPVGTIGIRLKQNVRSPDLCGCSFEFFDDGEACVPFFIGQPDNVNLFHGKTSVY
jgi:hypothetical protein